MKKNRLFYDFSILILFSCLLAFPTGALAVSWGTDLAITGELIFSGDYYDDSGTASGDINAVAGGSTSTTIFDGTGITSGSSPLSATLSETGDGFGANFSVASDQIADEFLFGVDLAMSLKNTSTDIYRVWLKINYNNSADADGTDAFAHSSFELWDDTTPADIALSDLFSNIATAADFDEVDGTALTTSGASLTAASNFLYDFVLNPGEMIDLVGVWNWDGGVFSAPGGSAISFSSFISVDSFENLNAPAVVPEPSTVVLLGLGLVGLIFMANKRSRHSNVKRRSIC